MTGHQKAAQDERLPDVTHVPTPASGNRTMTAVPTLDSGLLPAGLHKVTIRSVEPSWYVDTSGQRRASLDRHGRAIFEVAFDCADGRARMWLGVTREFGLYSTLRV
jgi:hypothetical protein